MAQLPTIPLNNGVPIPQFGFGVFQIPPERTAEAVRAAFDAGYRHIDTAQDYFNEEAVGHALRESGLSRDEVFVTTKLANRRHERGEAVTALEESLQRLGVDQVDLYLIHWPRPSAGRYVEVWRSFEGILAAGKARAIGVSNFQVSHLEQLADETDTVPAVNQIELHPLLVQADLREYHRKKGIVTESWSPLAKGGALLRDERLLALAKKYGRTPAQIVLRWNVQLGNVVIPKSVTPSRMRENIDVFDFELSAEDVARIEAFDTDTRTGPHPDHFG